MCVAMAKYSKMKPLKILSNKEYVAKSLKYSIA